MHSRERRSTSGDDYRNTATRRTRKPASPQYDGERSHTFDRYPYENVRSSPSHYTRRRSSTPPKHTRSNISPSYRESFKERKELDHHWRDEREKSIFKMDGSLQITIGNDRFSDSRGSSPATYRLQSPVEHQRPLSTHVANDKTVSIGQSSTHKRTFPTQNQSDHRLPAASQCERVFFQMCEKLQAGNSSAATSHDGTRVVFDYSSISRAPDEKHVRQSRSKRRADGVSEQGRSRPMWEREHTESDRRKCQSPEERSNSVYSDISGDSDSSFHLRAPNERAESIISDISYQEISSDELSDGSVERHRRRGRGLRPRDGRYKDRKYNEQAQNVTKFSPKRVGAVDSKRRDIYERIDYELQDAKTNSFTDPNFYDDVSQGWHDPKRMKRQTYRAEDKRRGRVGQSDLGHQQEQIQLDGLVHGEEDPTAASLSCDPTIRSILKSIGVSSDLSQLMKEKATKEEEKNKKKEQMYGIKETSSFLGTDMKHFDLTAVLKSGEKQAVPQHRLDTKRSDQSVEPQYHFSQPRLDNTLSRDNPPYTDHSVASGNHDPNVAYPPNTQYPNMAYTSQHYQYQQWTQYPPSQPSQYTHYQTAVPATSAYWNWRAAQQGARPTYQQCPTNPYQYGHGYNAGQPCWTSPGPQTQAYGQTMHDSSPTQPTQTYAHGCNPLAVNTSNPSSVRLSAVTTTQQAGVALAPLQSTPSSNLVEIPMNKAPHPSIKPNKYMMNLRAVPKETLQQTSKPFHSKRIRRRQRVRPPTEDSLKTQQAGVALAPLQSTPSSNLVEIPMRRQRVRPPTEDSPGHGSRLAEESIVSHVSTGTTDVPVGEKSESVTKSTNKSSTQIKLVLLPKSKPQLSTAGPPNMPEPQEM